MEISLTLNNELVFDKKINVKKVCLYSVVGITVVLLLVTVMSCDNSVFAFKPMNEITGKDVIKELWNDFTKVEPPPPDWTKHYFPISFNDAKEIAKYIGGKVLDDFIKLNRW